MLVPSVEAAAIVAPLKVNVPVPAPPTVPLPQFVCVAAGTLSSVMFAGSVSLNPTLVSGEVTTLAIVTVRRDVAPATTLDGEKDMAKFG